MAIKISKIILTMTIIIEFFQKENHWAHSCSVWYCTTIMDEAETIHFFTFIRKLFQRLGIHPPKPQNNTIGSYNWRNSFVLLFLTILFISSTAFLIFKSDSVAKFGSSFYVSISDLLYLFLWAMIVHKMADLFILMEKIDEFVAESKWSLRTLFNQQQYALFLLRKRKS